MYKIVKKIFDFITLIILTVSLIGAFGIITAPSQRQADDIKQLEKELGANEKSLKNRRKLKRIILQ